MCCNSFCLVAGGRRRGKTKRFELIVGMFTPQPELAVKEMLICILSLRNTNTVFFPLGEHMYYRAREEGSKSLPGLFCFFSFSKNNKTNLPVACRGGRRSLQTHINTRRHAQSHTHTQTLCLNHIILRGVRWLGFFLGFLSNSRSSPSHTD